MKIYKDADGNVYMTAIGKDTMAQKISDIPESEMTAAQRWAKGLADGTISPNVQAYFDNKGNFVMSIADTPKSLQEAEKNKKKYTRIGTALGAGLGAAAGIGIGLSKF